MEQIRPKKKFGQNFLIDNNILNKIVKIAEIEPNSLVIEIGIGTGNLTEQLIKEKITLLGYEIDNSLKEGLDKKFNNYSNLKIVYDDFLKRNLKEDLKPYENKTKYVIANLPYYITTPIITKIIESDFNPQKMLLMVQKEVGDRLAAQPGTKAYGSLTVFIKYYFEVKKMFLVSKNAFFPKPNVDSLIVKFEKTPIKYEVNNEKLFFKFVKDAFVQKRKTLKNNIKNYDLTKVEETLKKYNLDLTVRAEKLSIEQFIDITNNL